MLVALDPRGIILAEMTDRCSRPDGRKPGEIRPVTFSLNYVEYPEGSALIEMGGTRVLCNASIEERVPKWMAGRGTGWVTAEYALLPRSTQTRTPRETQGLRSRTQEIRRLIGRSLRAAVDLDLLGERMIIVDCDVLQADGGTRTAAVTGGYVALALALRRIIGNGTVASETLTPPIAAVGVGVVAGEPRVDLCYAEDRLADVDLNVVMTQDGHLIEVQGTAERAPFRRDTLDATLDLATLGIARLIRHQREALE
jgi:ribonuclease PH